MAGAAAATEMTTKGTVDLTQWYLETRMSSIFGWFIGIEVLNEFFVLFYQKQYCVFDLWGCQWFFSWKRNNIVYLICSFKILINIVLFYQKHFQTTLFFKIFKLVVLIFFKKTGSIPLQIREGNHKKTLMRCY